MDKYLLFSILLACSFFSAPAQAEQDAKLETKARMTEVYHAYASLQPFMGNREVFLAPKNDKEIAALLEKLSANFHRTDSAVGKELSQHGLGPTLTSVQETLNDIRVRFGEDKKEYALWRLRSLSGYCVTCHSRLEVPADFAGDSDKNIAGLNDYQKADYYFATRQFGKALEFYRKVAQDEEFRMERLDALRKLLVIVTRVYPDPSQALTELKEIRKNGLLSPYEIDEITDWEKGLREWEKEKTTLFVSEEKILAEAERLLRLAHGNGEAIDGQASFVYLLRASSLIHGLYDRPVGQLSNKAAVLYLLGAIYSDMPRVFQIELPDLFLEQCIRQFPNSEYAKKSFKRYLRNIEDGFTGSAGTDIPDDEKLKIEELRDLAFGKSTVEFKPRL